MQSRGVEARPRTIDVRLANEAWEALFRASTTIVRELKAGDVWEDLLENEYSVLYPLSTAPDGLRMTDLAGDVLITQPGLSRLIRRMEERGLVCREEDPDDGRASRIRLTEEGAAVQHRVGAAHARHVAAEMTSRLDREQLTELRDVCRRMLMTAPASVVADD
ncbi:MarR family winged helix-turn-helix transcriptional regulator [Microbacterium ulmi]|uniref:MarR family transcriptional regulator n=1 Tax=Microbacterium ulmi TaxID=179095 RepID=A0A7Y2M081_9MICO|nr:MarR family transcriptional regulator [Microbacterium ulmi]NII69332.1 DNA-binding MarR family transcriptional regulator [Microbacterium ulmi]NNH04055.1 MarR family transcriptional regulator [Microbacterium ulmi]